MDSGSNFYMAKKSRFPKHFCDLMLNKHCALGEALRKQMEEESRGIFARMEDESAALSEKIQSQSKVIGKDRFPQDFFKKKIINKFRNKGRPGSPGDRERGQAARGQGAAGADGERPGKEILILRGKNWCVLFF